ncbi:class I SAM-dependent methyltransferase [Microvirga calopogonii]|uniref:class I SAM-dependent methyltransferase n=1 Tax=Microvirga calopogonii TaxID=2078013 RepID=UPI000E0CC034|nr:class I SAM-dependent methyltransferase [Microvirga calopogonii]
MTDTTLDEAAVAAAWDRNAETWAQEVRNGLDLYRELYTFPAFLSFMPPIAGKRVIDLGCGEGSNTRRFARLGGIMTGVDLSSEMIGCAREQEEKEPLEIAYEIGSFSELSPLADGEFDVALSTMALMDGPDLSGALKAISRVLKPGGALCFSVLHPCFVTPAVKWLTDSAGAHLGLRVGRYFEREPFIEYWRFSRRDGSEQKQGTEPFEVPRFPRTLSDYINSVSDAGFRIVKLEEPRPSEELARKHDWLNRWYQHAPLVLFVLAVKA